jgi:hypothetical protein
MKDELVKLNVGVPWQKQHSTVRRLFNRKLDFNLGNKRIKCYIWRIILHGVETWTLLKVGHNYLGRFKMWCW